jgi:hypothetical protein
MKIVTCIIGCFHHAMKALALLISGTTIARRINSIVNEFLRQVSQELTLIPELALFHGPKNSTSVCSFVVHTTRTSRARIELIAGMKRLTHFR